MSKAQVSPIGSSLCRWYIRDKASATTFWVPRTCCALNLDDEILTIPAANFTQLSGMRHKPREILIVILLLELNTFQIPSKLVKGEDNCQTLKLINR